MVFLETGHAGAIGTDCSLSAQSFSHDCSMEFGRNRYEDEKYYNLCLTTLPNAPPLLGISYVLVVHCQLTCRAVDIIFLMKTILQTFVEYELSRSVLVFHLSLRRLLHFFPLNEFSS